VCGLSIAGYSNPSGFPVSVPIDARTHLYTAFLLFLTLPVTVATAERSFSKLKLIKTYLRNTKQQDRLSGLAISSIENAVARELDVSNIIDDFANRTAKKSTSQVKP
jgi:hypothetical protein